ncbi:MAG: DNA polymerase III subunit delta' [Candidatus Nanopelagicales bacterium]
MTWLADLVGQEAVAAQLERAARDATCRRGEAGSSMTHAWLLTGPPGSGRSTAALAFAAALQCPELGCGQCPVCQQIAAGGHPDVQQFIPEATQIRVAEVQELLHRAALAPVHGRWNVLIIEDADRLNDIAANALLKALEEPSPHTVWLLCAPAVDDVLPTISSRTRSVRLRTPGTSEVTHGLVHRYDVDPAMASFAARVSQGHIGRAKALASDEATRARRHEVLAVPGTLRGIGGCFTAAANLLAAATADAAAICDVLDAQQASAIARAIGEPGAGPGGARVKRAAAAAQKEFLGRAKARRTRMVRDQLDRALLDLLSLYRDVLAVQVGADVELINEELRPTVSSLAQHGQVQATYRRIAAIQACQLALAAAVSPLLALEAMTVQLADLA